MDKEKIKQKIKELETLGEELEALLEEPEDQADSEFRLKLNTGRFYYHGDGDIRHDSSLTRYLRCFNYFLTKEQSEIAVELMPAQNELLQMAFILNDDWKPNWKDNSEPKFVINYDHGSNNFFVDSRFTFSSGNIYFKIHPIKYFLATASDNLKSWIKGELQ